MIYDAKIGSKKETNTASEIKQITIDIEGAVAKPGIYNLKDGSIVEDVISLAGGLNDQADKSRVASEINRAEKLRDGQKILIPVVSVASVAGATTTAATSSQGAVVNINSATLSELDSLPGIGPTYAQRIIDYRVANGGFKSIDQIKNVSGIGDKTFEKFKDQITI